MFEQAFKNIDDATATETQSSARHYQQKQATPAALKKSLPHQAFTGALYFHASRTIHP
ncbi:MAG: hypothetical protein SH807_06040 [Blastochloris sp.]|nr:hypothetical protein [Blastochloris sp.]